MTSKKSLVTPVVVSAALFVLLLTIAGCAGMPANLGAVNSANSTTKASSTPPSPEFIYVANSESNDISGFQLDDATGKLTPVPGSPFAAPEFPLHLIADSKHKLLFIQSTGKVRGPSKFVVSKYSVDAETGALTLLAQDNILLNGMLLDGNDDHLYGSTGGAIAAFALDNSSNFSQIPGSPFLGNIATLDINAITPDGALFFSTFFSSFGDAVGGGITSFQRSPNGSLTATGKLTYFGTEDPTDMQVAPSGKFLLASYEIQSKIVTFAIAPDGSLQQASVPPAKTGTGSFGMLFDPSGKFVVVENAPGGVIPGAAGSALSVYSFNLATGQLSLVPGSPVALSGRPNFMSFSASGKYLLIPNDETNTLDVFGFDGSTGEITPAGNSNSVAAPGPFI